MALDDATAELIESLVAFGRTTTDPPTPHASPGDPAPSDASSAGSRWGGDEWSESAPGESFIRHYFDSAVPDDLSERPVGELLASATAHARLALHRRRGEPIVRVYQPALDTDGWASPHTVVDVVSDDMAFLVDSVTNEMHRNELRLHLVLHPVMPIGRSAEGDVIGVADSDDSFAGGVALESFIHIEVDRVQPHTLESLRLDVLRVLCDVGRAVEDWPDMAERAVELSESFLDETCPADPAEVSEAGALLAWMAEDHFTFLGYREYDLVETPRGQLALREVLGSGLGILRRDEPKVGLHSLTSPGAVSARSSEPLVLAKANSRATVHRRAYLDYVGLKKFDSQGNVIGERRFLGLFTSRVQDSSVFVVPIIRLKVPAVIERAALPLDGHAGKRLVDILETYPRDELFQITVDELFANVIGILRLQERQRVRVFVRHDRFERFVSCLVYVPRDQYTTIVRRKMSEILREAFDGTSVDYNALVADSVLARLHVVVHTVAGAVPDIDASILEDQLLDSVRSWSDDLYDALVETCGESEGVALHHLYSEGFGASYRDEFAPSTALDDVRSLDALAPLDLSMRLYRQPGAAQSAVRLKIYTSAGRMSLSDVVPLLENLGVVVVDERPFPVLCAGGPLLWIYDFGLQVSDHAGREIDNNRDLFLDAFAAVWKGEAESDGFNRLVLEAGLEWRTVSVIRAYRKYQRQIGSMFSDAYVQQCLVAHGDLVRLLMAIFDTRMNPARPGDRAADLWLLDMQVDSGFDAITSLDDDRILRAFRSLVMATTRTNFYRLSPDGRARPALSLKLDPSGIEDMPLPRPMFEIFVYSPSVEGVHLRGAKVARGGIRWSDRREDFRVEILGLMKAQMVKNAVIVPSGAKGGFIVKQSRAGSAEADEAGEAVAAYREFISALLDITDNLVDGKVVAPTDVIRLDGDDPYLVVAADKGTATFSDIANMESEAAGFWLGDAFASGGSAGYDHKVMGITAKGAWESVKRHFREIGLDTQSSPFTVMGIGDMSGDVFGNAMLQSSHLCLVGAFDHRHIFIDPDPNPELGFAERKRLYGLERSSWDDYDRFAISRGGGVFSRSVKSIDLTPEIRAVLQIDDDKLTPEALVRALLVAPVDLLFNGGIGTYVKAAAESHLEVGDKANDAVRVDGQSLACRVVGEGGNLGFTQRGRIEYALAGGRIYTDAIDNSAGVDCSDHEVNIKILLGAAVREGAIDRVERDRLLVAMTDDVATAVLRDNYDNTQALSIAASQSLGMAEVHGRYINELVRSGHLDRRIEYLPAAVEIAERAASGKGLTSPELAVLLAYTKVLLGHELAASTVPAEPFWEASLERYFPPLVREGFAAQLSAHPLRAEIIAVTLANLVVNRGGTSMLYRLADETQMDAPALVRCHLAAGEMFEIECLWRQIESLDSVVADDAQIEMLLACRRLVERSTRWLVTKRKDPIDVGETIAFFQPGIRTLRGQLSTLVVGDDLKRHESTVADLVSRKVPHALAAEVAGLEELFSTLDIIDLSFETNQDVVAVAAVYFELVHRLHLDGLRDLIASLPRDSRWHTQARGAIRADLYARMRALTVSVVTAAGSPAEGSAGELIDTWAASRERSLDRYHQVVADVNAGGTADLAVLSVALRAVVDLTDS